MPNPPDYEAIVAAGWRANAGQVVNMLEANNGDLLRKIQTYSQNFGYNSEDVKGKIRKDPMFAAHFAKNPTRTSFYEKEACEWLTRKLQINVGRLPQSGPEALYVNSDGVVVSLGERDTKPSKALDFRWSHGGVTFYAMHKYTKQSGGAQDNQFNEMVKILRNFQSAADTSIALLIIVDGAYYTEAKMRELTNFT